MHQDFIHGSKDVIVYGKKKHLRGQILPLSETCKLYDQKFGEVWLYANLHAMIFRTDFLTKHRHWWESSQFQKIWARKLGQEIVLCKPASEESGPQITACKISFINLWRDVLGLFILVMPLDVPGALSILFTTKKCGTQEKNLIW